MPSAHFSEEERLLLAVLGDAQGNFNTVFEKVRQDALARNKKDNGVLLHDAWMRSMHQAFDAAYKSDPRSITVFAKPLKPQPGLPVTKTPYNRGEFGFDLAVVEMRDEDAPYGKADGRPRKVKVVARHLWQVESEIRNDATKLSEDLGKLIGGAASCKLLVTLIPKQRDGGAAWRGFIERAARSVHGRLYVAMLPSYGGTSGGEAWRRSAPEMHVYRLGQEQTLRLLASLPARTAAPAYRACARRLGAQWRGPPSGHRRSRRRRHIAALRANTCGVGDGDPRSTQATVGVGPLDTGVQRLSEGATATGLKKRAVILISGRGSNMAALLAAAAAPAYPASVALVLSNRADAAGLARAAAAGVPTAVVESRAFRGDREAFERAVEAELARHGAELVALAGFMRVLTPGFVHRWEGRLVNIHPSLLPAFPGLDTHARALAAGARLHGCTVHLVSAGVDEGPILAQAAVPVLDADTAETLAARVLEQEHRLYPAALAWLASGRVRLEGGRARVVGGAAEAALGAALANPLPPPLPVNKPPP
jgi:phosphoribosylglycinamide formyltransferase-1